MQLVRFAIVIFFLVVVPAAAAVDAMAPQFLDAAMGRKPRSAAMSPAPWAGDGSLSLRAGASEPPATPVSSLSSSATSVPVGATDVAAPFPSDTSVPVARENTNAVPPSPQDISPATVPEASITGVRPHEPVFRDVPAGAPSSATSTPSPADSQLVAIQNHLGELGATYMRLETTGSGARMYRFLCQMQLNPGKSEVVPFEATAADPLEAMHRVLSDVEAWQATEITRLRR